MNKSRILVIDDNESIHQDFRAILAGDSGGEGFEDFHADFFDLEPAVTIAPIKYELDSAFQGEEGFRMVKKAIDQGNPYAFAFIDMRMPPGWDGLETLKHVLDADSNIQAVICTAYSDRSWADFIKTVGYTDRLLILKKPFDNAEVSQIAAALTKKHELARKAELRMEELEEMVNERTAKIVAANQAREQAQRKQLEQERQLMQKQKLESLGLLAGGVAHDVNNFLHIAQGSIEFAQQVADASETETRCCNGFENADTVIAANQVSTEGPAIESSTGLIQKRLRVASDAINDAAAIVSQILDFSRRDTGITVEIYPEEVIQDCCQLLRPLLGQSTPLQLDLGSSLSDYSVDGDASSIEQILINLCTNARDAMPDGGVITLRAYVESDVDRVVGEMPHRLAIEVVDQGGGIPEELRDRILDPFFTTKDIGKGTGLGLSTVDAIIRRHKGVLEVNSSVGQGSTFRVLLPLRHRDKRIESELETDDVKNSTTVTGAGKKIMVTDDSSIIRDLTRYILSEHGFQIVEAEDGQQAVEVAKLHSDLSLLIMDVQMPILDGRRAASLINSNGRKIPVIFCSGFDPYETNVNEEVPELPYPPVLLPKPFDQDGLLSAVSEALNLIGDTAE